MSLTFQIYECFYGFYANRETDSDVNCCKLCFYSCDGPTCMCYGGADVLTRDYNRPKTPQRARHPPCPDTKWL